MTGQMRTRGGAVLLQRLGALRMGEQSRWNRAPAGRGLWAFPWPMFEMFFAYHQYTDALPLRLRSDAGVPLHRSAWVDTDGNPPPEGLSMAEIHEDRRFAIRDGFYDEQREWIRTVGRRVVRRHQFWYDGDLYTHLSPRGEILALDEWRRMPAITFAEAVRRSGADLVTYRTREEQVVRRSGGCVDHLEVFIPAGAGALRGRGDRHDDPRSRRR